MVSNLCKVVAVKFQDLDLNLACLYVPYATW